MKIIHTPKGDIKVDQRLWHLPQDMTATELKNIRMRIKGYVLPEELHFNTCTSAPYVYVNKKKVLLRNL